jgi:hypothetical protein
LEDIVKEDFTTFIPVKFDNEKAEDDLYLEDNDKAKIKEERKKMIEELFKTKVWNDSVAP